VIGKLFLINKILIFKLIDDLLSFFGWKNNKDFRRCFGGRVGGVYQLDVGITFLGGSRLVEDVKATGFVKGLLEHHQRRVRERLAGDVLGHALIVNFLDYQQYFTFNETNTAYKSNFFFKSGLTLFKVSNFLG